MRICTRSKGSLWWSWTVNWRGCCCCCCRRHCLDPSHPLGNPCARWVRGASEVGPSQHQPEASLLPAFPLAQPDFLPVTNPQISKGVPSHQRVHFSYEGPRGACRLCINHFAPGAPLYPAPRILQEPDTFPGNYNSLGAGTAKRVGGY